MARESLDDFERELIACRQYIVKNATVFTRNADKAEDLAGLTIVKALAKRHQFTPGSNMRGWLYVIMRNEFLTSRRRSRQDHEQLSYLPESGQSQEDLLEANDDPHATAELRDMLEKMAGSRRLKQREIDMIIDLRVYGFTISEAAAKYGVAEGTIKSMTNRATKKIRKLAGMEE